MSAFNYEQPTLDYATHRRTDPRIAAHLHRALGGARTVLNVGAGAGSYEPDDRYVVAVEPSASMRRSRLLNHRPPAINVNAEALPFDDDAFEASMATVTVHHWPDLRRGLEEMRRVTRDRIVIMTFDPEALHTFWNAEYFPDLVEIERQRYPTIGTIAECLGGPCEVIPVPVALDCVDGFQEAFYGRPEAFLQPAVRRAQSAWGFLPPELEQAHVQSLATDLASGAWDRKYGKYRTMQEATFALRLVVLKLGLE